VVCTNEFAVHVHCSGRSRAALAGICSSSNHQAQPVSLSAPVDTVLLPCCAAVHTCPSISPRPILSLPCSSLCRLIKPPARAASPEIFHDDGAVSSRGVRGMLCDGGGFCVGCTHTKENAWGTHGVHSRSHGPPIHAARPGVDTCGAAAASTCWCGARPYTRRAALCLEPR